MHRVGLKLGASGKGGDKLGGVSVRGSINKPLYEDGSGYVYLRESYI